MSLSLPHLAGERILVVGDVMLDRYWTGDTGRISPEAPVPVVRVAEQRSVPGGAGNVALNLAALGLDVTLAGVTGDDEAGRELATALAAAGVSLDLRAVADVPTITKLRVLSRNQQLIRLDFEEDLAGMTALDPSSVSLEGFDLLVLSDYAKGTLADVAGFIAAADAAGVPVLVDPKGVDFDRYRGATLMTPNLSEFHAVVGETADEGELVARASALRTELALDALLVTRGSHGMTLISDEGVVHLPAEAREVFDVTGAGDTVIAMLGAALAGRLGFEQAAQLANLAAGVAVGKIGTATVTREELQHAMHRRGVGGRSMVTTDELLANVAAAHDRGQRVVMTNGCFDILHAGHVAYLEEAKRLGDRLIIAVNDDDSVTRLKGEGRPVNPLGDRMAVLAALAAVDWVVSFAEDTPADLIAQVRPDVLVKGGDYRPEQIAGASAVLDAGGEVRVLEFQDGRSTTRILADAAAAVASSKPDD
jgi:D-beta-D-heptose 7-phosphate kinase/D-beta-D-heptose 1-phosphate adenosyltransferase